MPVGHGRKEGDVRGGGRKPDEPRKPEGRNSVCGYVTRRAAGGSAASRFQPGLGALLLITLEDFALRAQPVLSFMTGRKSSPL